MSRCVDPLVVGRVIGEVVDMFVPSVAMAVAYGARDLSNGCHVKPSLAADQPLVRISGRRNDLYTLVRPAPAPCMHLTGLDRLVDTNSCCACTHLFICMGT